MSNLRRTVHKKWFPVNWKLLSSRAKQNLKYLVCSALVLLLIFSFLVPNLASAVTAGRHIQSDPPSFTFTAGGDIGANTNTSAGLDLIAQSGSQFDLVLGDLSYSEITPESAWCSYVQSHVGSTFPFELVSGNHEDGGEFNDGLIDNFVQCLPDRLGAQGTYGKEYYFDYPASAPLARFVMISPGLTFTNGGYYDYSAGSAHYNWVANTIDSARAAGIKWIIVGMHKDCISMGIQPCEIGNDLPNLLISKKVDLILQGHDHDYQRSKQLALNGTTCPAVKAETYNPNCVVNNGSTGVYTKGAGPIVVIDGAVGSDLYTLSNADGDAGYFARWMGNNVNPTNGLTKFSLSADQLTVSANFMGSTAPNNFTDSFSITSAPPTPTPGGIALRAASSSTNGTGSSSLTLPVPAGTSSGDVMVAHVVVQTAGNAITPPAGWSLVLRQDTASALSTATYVKVASSTEPASYTWSFGTAGEASGGIASYSGVDNTTPVDVSHAQYNSSTTNMDNSGVTTSYANDLLVYAVGLAVVQTVNVPPGFAEQWYSPSASSTTSEMSQEFFASTGATGTIHGMTIPATSSITMLIALKPAAATPPPPPSGIALRAASSSTNGAGGSSLTLPVPAGTSSGDVMVAFVVVQTAGNAITPPAGWNLVLRQNSSSALATASYVKVAGGSEPASYTWNFGTAGQASGWVASYIGVNTSVPVDTSHGQYNASTSNVDNSGLTTTAANDLLVYAVGIVAATSVNDPSGFTEEAYAASNALTTAELSQELFPSAGATGTIHGTLWVAYSNITQLIALRPAGATPPVTLRAASSATNGTGGSSLTLPVPAGTSSGDVMVAHIVVQTASNAITPPAGWSLVLRQDTASALATASYVKVAGGSEPASYTWNFGTAGQASGGIASYIGVDTTAPVDARHAQYNNGTSNVDNSGVTTSYANDLLVYAVGIVAATSVNVPPGFTEEWRASSSSSTTSEMSQELFASTGATGTIHGTLSSPNSNITMLIALKPAGATSPPPSGISLRAAASSNNGAGGSSLTLTVPAGTSSGDVMVAFVVVQTAGNAITPPAGWSLVLRQNTGSALATASYVKVAGGSEPASYTWSFGTAGQASGWVASYIGVNTSAPVDTSHGQYNASTSNVDNSGLTTSYANDLLVYAVGIVAAASVNDPSGFTEECYTASNALTTAEMSQELFASAGATGTIHGTLWVAYSNITQLIALRPA